MRIDVGKMLLRGTEARDVLGMEMGNADDI